MSTAALSLPRRFASLVKFEHTIFALPFAYVGAFLAVDGYPGTANLVWLTLAMVGARTLAMALNRLVDAELDARNPRTAGREIPAGMLSRGAGLGPLRCGARALPRRGLPARPDRPLALADPGRHVRRLPVPEARHLALPPLARRLHRARPARRLARGDRGRRRGRRGRSSPRRVSGSRASTSSTRSSTSSTTAPPGLRSWAVRFGERGVFAGARAFHVAAVALLAAVGPGLGSDVFYWLGVAAVAGAPRLRALARAPRRPAPPRRRLLHRQRRHQRRLLRLRRARHDGLTASS